MSMNRYFQDELAYLREIGDEFARENPRLAPYLARESRDPDVERLLEGFAFLTGRLREKLDDELPEVAHSLIELVWPNYLRPVPAMTVIEFSVIPGADAGAPVERGTMVASREVGGTTCRFRTSYDVQCLPMSVAGVEVDSTPTTSRLTVKLQLLDGVDPTQIDADRLRLFLDGAADASIARDLYRALMQDVRSISVLGGNGSRFTLDPDAVSPVGFDTDHAVLPYPPNAFSGFRILQEYFAFPEKFMFVDIHVGNRLRTLRGPQIELKFEFSRPLDRGGKAGRNTVRLNCTPAVNVFEDDGEPVNLDHRKSEYRVRPMGGRDRQIDVYGVEKVVGWVRGRNEQVVYKPFASYRPIVGKAGEEVYYRIRRRGAVASQTVDAYISFVDAESRAIPLAAETVSIELTCTNGRAPEALAVGAIDQPTATSPTFATFRNPIGVTAQTPPPIDRNLLWILISNLALNYSSLADTHALGRILSTYNVRAQVDEQERRRMELLLEGIQSVRSEPMDWMRSGGVLRGVRFMLNVQESKLGGAAELFLFGTVFDRFLDMFSNINSVHQLTIQGVERNVRYQWGVRTGQNRIL
ncbi:type VI secretion system baseplate subunit TssF [Thalassobaculum sp.]|uniref:type VI secretion system baseplate subunit TssF n=1 Tax=Thalassobaculum sp. TaxID=2022740 RepID=UPI0032EF66C5